MMNKAYTRINWENEPSILTPLNEINLNKMDSAINEIDNRVISLDTTKANESDALLMLKDVTYNPTTGVFTFTKKNGTQIIADLNIEKIPVSFSMSKAGVITMTTTDGTTYTADVSKLIKTYSFEDTDTINMSVYTDADGNKTITADIIDGSITDNKLQPNYLADITTQANKSEESAGSSLASANASEISAKASESWAVGGTNTREGEDTNNAKYWSEQAKSIVGLEWDGIQNKPFTSIGDNLTVDENGRLNAQKSASTWNDIEGKPFSTIGDNLEVVDGKLNAKGGGNDTLITDKWDSTRSYTAGNYVIHNDILYRVKADCSNITPPNTTYYEPTNVGTEVNALNSRINNISMDLDYTNAVEIPMNSSQTINYNPPSNGFIYMTGYGSANSFIACQCGVVKILQQATSNNYVGFTFPVTKGVVTDITTSSITTNRKIWFVPYK